MSQPITSPPITSPAIATVPLSARPAARESNVKETVEQILVAFILAFIFRCFIVEAFVIPTGSMATTLLGAHMDFRCPDCGWTFNVNYSGDDDGDDVRVPAEAAEVYAIRCPNCGFKLPRTLAGDPANDASFPAVQYGDRILVQKYIYLVGDPKRWDVVVFKNPDTARTSAGDDAYTQNYIKRLIGLPGETIMVLDGDIYVSKSDKPTAQLAPGDFTVQTKPAAQQAALWRVVYDNDHLPRALPRAYPSRESTAYDPNPQLTVETPWRQPWTPAGAGWDVSGGRTFRFDGQTRGQSGGQLSFEPGAVPEKRALTDWLAYDVSYNVNFWTRRGRTDFFNDERYESMNAVSDVKLALTYRRLAGEGPLRLNLTKQSYTFTAELTPTTVRLLMTRPGETRPTTIGESPLRGASPARVEFANVDYRVSVRINGDEVLATTAEQFHPDIARLLKDFEDHRRQEAATVSIAAEAQKAELTHVSLWRDVYYLNNDWASQRYHWAMPDNFPMGTDATPDRPIQTTRHLMRLGKDEFFTMGDNSMLSSDARCWETPVNLPYENVNVAGGRVPRRFLLGRAFFVYWPAGFAPVKSLPGFVPNFGEMRFIH